VRFHEGRRHLPIVELNNSSTPTPLEVFPTIPVIKKGSEITEQLKTQSAQIEEIATQMNQRRPLLPGFFPNPTDPQKYRFRDAYEKHMTKELPAILNAATPPTETDLQKAREELWKLKFAERIITVNGVERNREQVDREYLEEVQNLLEKLEREVARKHWMYIESEAINKNTLVCLTEARTKSAQFRAPPQCGSHR